MILEIYDYLWIRNALLGLDVKQLNQNITTKEEYIFVIKCITNLMETEDFPLAFPQTQEKISEIVQTNRFKYNDKQIVEDINYIIERLNEYKSMSKERRQHLIKEFYVQELKVRDIPFPYNTSKEVVDCLIQTDIHTFRDIFCYDASAEPKPMSLNIEDILDYASLTNLLLNKYPTFFEDETMAKNTVHNLDQLVEIRKLPYAIRKNIKKVIKKLNPENEKTKKIIF